MPDAIPLKPRYADPEVLELSDSDTDTDLGAQPDEHSAAAGLLGGRRGRRTRRFCWPQILRWRPRRRPRSALQHLRLLLTTLLYATLAFTVLSLLRAAVSPTYTPAHYPAHFLPLEDSITRGGGDNPLSLWTQLPGEHPKHTLPGRGNPSNERIFIAANIVNGELITHDWGPRVMELIDLLGPSNVFLSIFENDSGPATTAALRTLDTRIAAHFPAAGRSIVSTQLPLTSLPRLRLPDNTTHLKRIRYLAELRNRALLPLIRTLPTPAPTRWSVPAPSPAPAPAPPTHYAPRNTTRILFLNDVVFSPRELVHLLFSTHRANYTAACGLDFISPLKFYDTFATRDASGQSVGVPFFPFFATAAARAEVLRTTDAVPVASCWGGAIAMSAAPFVRAENPVRFRAEENPYWEASECCLVNADLGGGVFVNPFVRSAYSRETFGWLGVARRVERAFAWVQAGVVWALGMPWGGERRGVREGERWSEKVRVGGEVVEVGGVAGKGMFCGSRKLLVMEEGERKEGQRAWKSLKVPDVVG